MPDRGNLQWKTGDVCNARSHVGVVHASAISSADLGCAVPAHRKRDKRHRPFLTLANTQPVHQFQICLHDKGQHGLFIPLYSPGKITGTMSAKDGFGISGRNVFFSVAGTYPDNMVDGRRR